MLYAVFALQDGDWIFRKAFYGDPAGEQAAEEFIRVTKWLYPGGMEIRYFEDTGVVHGNSTGRQKNL